MRQDLVWFPSGKNDEFKTLNTRKTKDELEPSDLQSISNFTFDELGGLKKILGNSLISPNTITTTSSQPDDDTMVDCYWDDAGDVQNDGNLKRDNIGLKFPDAFFAALSGTVSSATLNLTTVDSNTFIGDLYQNTEDFTEATASPPTYDSGTSVSVNASGEDTEHTLSIPTTMIDDMVSTNYGMQIVADSDPTGYFYSSLGGLSFYSGVSGYWKCDETETPLVDSFTGGGHDLDYVGSPTSITGKLGLAHGGYVTQNNYFRADHSADWNITGGTSSAKVSVEAWVKFGNTGDVAAQFILGNVNNSYAGQNDSLIFGMQGSANFGIGSYVGNGAWLNPGAYDDGEWHYVVGIYDNTLGSKRGKVYIDGVEVATSNTQVGFTQADGYMLIGNSSAPHTYWRGAGIDDVVYWHGTAMTEAQITERYNSGLGRIYG